MHEQFQAALIDEFQDTDPIQYEIFARAFAKRPLFLIGDPKQAIYAFRGADVFAYREAQKDARQSYTLSENWRSEPEMVDAVDAVLGRPELPFVYDWIPLQPVRAAERADQDRLTGDDRAPLQWWFLPQIDDKARKVGQARECVVEAVAAEIVRLLGGKLRIGEEELQPRDLAVLVRTNKQAADVQERLVAAGVPSVISSTGDIFESHEMTELERVLCAVADPRDATAVRAALATEMWGCDATEIHRQNEDDEGWQQLVDRLAEYRDAWLTKGFMPMLEALIVKQEVRLRLLTYEDGERRLTNLTHAAELLHQAEEEQRLSPEGLIQWLSRTRSRGLADPERAELRLETDEDAVQIATIHKSKGLEYGIVFCPFLWDGRAIDPKEPTLVHTGGGLVYDLGSGSSEEKIQHVAMAEAERMAEDLRLVYVALTRAKHRCYVAWAYAGPKGQSGAATSALGYLLHPPPQCSADDPAALTAQIIDHLQASVGQWQGDLEQFVAKHPGLMEMSVIDDQVVAGTWQPRQPESHRLEPRRFPTRREGQLRGWRMASYSSLIRTVEREAEAPDHGDPAVAVEPADEAPAGIFAFAKGTRAGTCLHKVLERCALDRDDSARNREIIEEVLSQQRLLDASAHNGKLDPVQDVHDMIRRIASTPLPSAASEFALADLADGRRLDEWGFHLPLAPLASPDLMAPFRAHGQQKIRKQYAPMLAEFSAEQRNGYLTGFVDLIFEHEGKWHIIDWKSNHLGNRAQDYRAPAMWLAMCEHHYVLQYHLYCVALDRFLRQRLPEYTYEDHFGGVWYVFLRGVDGSAEHGWYYDRPPETLIRALDERIEGRDQA